MRTEILLLLCVASGLAGCATPAPLAGNGTAPGACMGASEDPATCAFPPDVRAFLEDRALCDHFRGEPWPEGDGTGARDRRNEIIAGVRGACAGTDRRLRELKARYRDDAALMQALSRYEANVEP